MPYATVTPTIERIRAVMNPGVHYAAYTIAGKLGVFAADVHALLGTMQVQGIVTKERLPNSRASMFILKGTQGAAPTRPDRCRKAPEVDPAMVATPRRHIVLTGQITGYDAEFARRAELCMLARGALTRTDNGES